MDELRVHVVFNAEHRLAARWYVHLLRLFDDVGMQRDGLRFSVPVRQRSLRWPAPQPGLPDGSPRRIDFGQAKFNAVVVLQDADMADQRALWDPYLADIVAQHDARPDTSLIVPVPLGSASLAPLRHLQGATRLPLDDEGDEPEERRARRLFIALLNAILVKLDPLPCQEPAGSRYTLFISHAKRDGQAAARRVAERLGATMRRLGPDCFFDIDSLIPGDDWSRRFEETIGRSSLLALVTDAYHSRPWCRWEMLCAKRHGRPVVVADLGRGRVERSFPYAGNVPTIRLDGPLEDLSDNDIETLVMAVLSESLRVHLWRSLAQRRIDSTDVLAIRPPELSDLASLAAEDAPGPRCLVYPDPPLGTEEVDLLRSAFPQIALRSLSQKVTGTAGPAPGQRLAGQLVAVSLSEADDTGMLGFAADQLVRVLEAILTPLVSEGARVAYGGRIRLPSGMRRNYTLEIAEVLGEAYRRLDIEPGVRPLVHFIAQHRLISRTEPAEVVDHLRRLAPYGEAWLLDAQGVAFIAACIDHEARNPCFVIKPHPARGGADARSRETFSGAEEFVRTRAYAQLAADLAGADASFARMRDAMTSSCHARIAVGGRFTGFSGAMSGLAEEALCSIRQGRPLAVLGGFGGSARDIAIALGLGDAEHQVPRADRPDTPRYQSGMAELRQHRAAFEQAAGGRWPLLQRLAMEENLIELAADLTRFLAADSSQVPV